MGLRRFGEFERSHCCERGTPLQETAVICVDCRRKELSPRGNGVKVCRLPEQHVDGVKRHVGAQTRGGVDCDESAPRPSVEDVARCQVTMEKSCRWNVCSEPTCEVASPFVQTGWDPVQEFW